MEFQQLALKTRSYRRFDQSVPVPRETLLSLIASARTTPSGGNLQKLRYLPVTDPDECRFLTGHLKWAAYLTDWNGPAEGERPTAFLLLLSDAASAAPLIDIGISAETVLLDATSRGFGGCMFLNIDRPAVAARLGIGENMRLDMAIALGKPAETVRVEDAEGDIRYYRDKDGTHIVPKRRLTELIYQPEK